MLRSTFLNAVASTAVLLTSFPLVAQTTLAQKVVSDSILPQDTYLYISVPDVEAVKSALESSSFGQLWNDPVLAEFKDEVMTAFEDEMQEEMEEFEAASGMTLEEALALPSGEISLAISATGNSVGAVLFFDIGDNLDKVEPLLDQAVDALSQQRSLTPADTSYKGIDITAFELADRSASPTPLTEEFGWFIADDRMVASSQLELLEAVIDNWSGESGDSFVNNDHYQFVMERCDAVDNPALSKLYVDPMGLFTKLTNTPSLGRYQMGAAMAGGMLSQFGLTQLKAMGAVGQQGEGEFEAFNRSVVYMEQPSRGVMRVFELDQAETTPPTWVKNNVSMYASMNWEMAEAFNAIQEIVDGFQGAGRMASMLDDLANRPPGIHIKNDLIDNMTGGVQLVQAPSSTSEFGGDEFLIALALRNEDAISDLVSRIAGMAGMEMRDFRGSELYAMDLPEGQAFSLTVKDGNLLFSVGSSLMEQVLRNDDDMQPLAESEEFRSVAAHFPANAVSVSFTRPAETYRSLYEMLRTGDAEQFPGMQDIFEKIDFTKLPPFEAISKYFKPTGAYAIQDANGYFMEGFQLK